ncbi:IPT/TIG domain-containing protein [Dyadobacter pollutisoli]|uniref:IPT/TIG domain-containing protein n=1 Tax=Dyadobacter pollutisoli TaxID=2910158 RepID=A0A9E8N461_9BACT|nr:IPT/TIG domain-containing protein [Dyadobacter pollutisoli]WAC09424.1 IPT/TIG domain-containing protein [Dyadobacter pollutisoli]
MKILILNRRLLSLMCLILSVAFITACNDDDDEVNSGEVQLLSFGPSGVKPGEEISFIGNNLDKVTSIELPGASVPSSAFLKQTAELITLNVPKETEEGLVTLKTAAGDIVSKTILSFEVPVIIKTVTAEAKPGTNVTITGEFLNWVDGVTFAPDTTVTKFVSQTMTELVVAVPVNAKTGKLVLYSGGTEPLSTETEKELVVTLPTITTLAPNPATKGKSLTITGTNLDLAEGVLFTGSAAAVTKFVSKSATQIVVTVPADAAKGKVSLITYSNVEVPSKDELKL